MIFYVDPMSESNLAAYDYELLSRIKLNCFFIGRDNYDNKRFTHHPFYPIFSYYKKPNPLLKLLEYFKNLLSLTQLVSTHRPKIIHVQWMKFPPLDYIFYKFLKQRYKLKLVYTAHNMLPHDTGEKRYNEYKRLYNLSDSIIVHTETTANNLSKLFDIDKGKIIIAPHGPIEDVVSKDIVNFVKTKLIKEYNLENKVVFSILGTQSKYKGSDIAVSAWQKAVSDHAVLILAGSIKDFNLPKESINGLIIIPRKLTPEEMSAIFEITDCLLLPYRKIDQSGVLLSAIAKEIPFAATNVGELQKPIDLGNIGWKLSENVEQSLIDLFEKLAESPDLIKSIKLKADWESVKKNYSWTRAANITTNLYSSLSKLCK